jgi:MoaA/NifB/PqqE/SkfB family radical SAM enzyme
LAYIEISSACNANCVFCPGGPKGLRRGRFMPPILFEKILRKAKREGFVNGFISPYNKGEPLLHPALSEILGIVRGLGMKVAISSNLINLPDFNAEMLSTIHSFDISLSGFTNEIYRLNHRGGDICRVRSNILSLRDQRDSAGLSFPITVKWHRYRYNEHEIEEAGDFFVKEGIAFSNYVAFFGAAKEFEEYYEGKYPENQRQLVKERIFSEIIDYSVERHKGIKHCALSDILTINEAGQVLLCCAYTSTPDSVIGDYLSLSRNEILAARAQKSFCAKCMTKGWAGFFAAGE